MKIIFAGTPEFAATALAALHQAGHEIVLVLTQPDRPAGRGMQLQPSAVKQFALAHNLPVEQPISLRLEGKYPTQAQAAHQLIASTPHDVMIVAAYGLILPQSILTIPPLGCINIHASLLPRWRGAAPIHRAIEAGDANTGITIMQMDVGLDTGDMLLVEDIAIAKDDTTATLHDKLAVLGGDMIVQALAKLAQLQQQAKPQPQEGVCYAAKISKEEAALDLNQSAQQIARKIRAFNPFPGATVVIHQTALKVFRAEVVDEKTELFIRKLDNLKIGEVCVQDQTIYLGCAAGVLNLLELQKAGGKKLPTAEFLKGFHFGEKALKDD